MWAASGDAAWESERVKVTVTYRKPVERVALHVLAVGVSRYADTSLNTKYAAEDAKAIAALFDRRGRQLFRDVTAHVLTDTDATRKKIGNAAAAIAKAAKPEDVLLVYLAGHGSAVGKRYFFIPHEFARTDGRTAEEDVRKQAN